MLTLYSMSASGNSYKCRLLLSLLNKDYQLIDVDPSNGDTRHPNYLALNKMGKAPLLVLESGEILLESNAILYFLAQNSPYWPDSQTEQARVLQWMFFEQYYHEPNIAVRQTLLKLNSDDDRKLSDSLKGGYRALDVMEDHLNDAQYFGADKVSIADVALFGYTHNAEKGGFDLGNYPKIRDWIVRINNIDNFVAQTFKPKTASSFGDMK